MKFTGILVALVVGAVWIAPTARATDPDQLVAAARTATQERFPDADTVLLSDHQHIVYQPDGSYVDTDDFAYKIMTEKGRRDLRTVREHFNSAYGSAAFDNVEIIRDGKVLPIDVARFSKTAVDSSQMGANIYDPANKVIDVTIPDLRVGDILRTRVRRICTKPRLPGAWSGIFLLQSTEPILEYVVRIDAPASLPLKKHFIKDPVPGTVSFTESRSGDRILYTWRAANVPRMFPEPDMPPVSRSVQRLLAGTVADWPELSRWYAKLSRPHLDKVSPEIRAKVAELIKGAKSGEEKIMRLFQFVSQQIRYMGVTLEKEAPGYEPHDVDLTFRNRYGVCRDKAALLVAMLETAGIDAWPVLFSAGSKKDAEVPNIYFNHAIVAAKLPGSNDYILMDPTYETTTELLPSGLADQSYLVARPEGDTLRTSPVIPAARNMVTVHTTGEMSRDGNVTGEATFKLEGVNDQVYRDAFSRWPLENRRQFLSSQLKRSAPGAELVDFTIEPADVRDMSKPLTVKIKFTVSLPVGDGLFPLALPSFGDLLGVAGQMLGSMGLDARKYPMELYSTCGVRSRSEYRLPEGIYPSIQPHPQVEIGTDALHARGTTAFKDGRLIETEEFTIDLTTIDPAQYRKLKEALRRLETLNRSRTLFRADGKISDYPRTFPSADSVDLQRDSDVRFLSGTERETTLRRKIAVLNYAGVKRNSELQINYQPELESVEIADAAVIDPDGTRHDLTPKEIHRMDAEWAAAAPRYPAGKSFVVNFPGVKPGSTIEYTLKTRRRSPLGATAAFSFGATDPILDARFHWSAAPGVTVAALPTPPELESPAADTLRRRNIPAVEREPGMIDVARLVPTQRLGETGFVRYAALLKKLPELAKNQPKAAAKAKELCAGLQDERAKIRAIRDFIERHIRTVDVNWLTLPESAWTPADRTLADGYGNRADRAILYRAMLDAVGVPSTFVAASGWADTPQNREQAKLPGAAGSFSHVLVKVGSLYLNDGDEYDDLGAGSYHETLAFDPATGSVSMIQEERPPIDEARTTDISLRPNGSAEICTTLKFYGTEYGAAKRRYAEMTPEELRRHIEGMVTSIAMSARLTGDFKTDFESMPGVVRFRVEVPDFAPEAGGARQLELPDFDAFAGVIRTAATQRKHPYERTSDLEKRLTWQINYPENWQVLEMPRPGEWIRPLEIIKLKTRKNARSLEITADVKIEAGEMTPSAYAELAKVQKELNAPSRRLVIFKEKK